MSDSTMSGGAPWEDRPGLATPALLNDQHGVYSARRFS
jgi:hypothetical protein